MRFETDPATRATLIGPHASPKTKQTAEEKRKTNKQTGKSHHPAPVPFQALRIEVNKEFDAIKTFMSEVLDYLAPGGILAVIRFHSFEDQCVTRSM